MKKMSDFIGKFIPITPSTYIPPAIRVLYQQNINQAIYDEKQFYIDNTVVKAKENNDEK